MSLEKYTIDEAIFEHIENDTQALSSIQEIMEKYGISVDRLLLKRDIGEYRASGFLKGCGEAGDFDRHISEQFREEIASLMIRDKYNVVCEKVWNKLAERRFLWCSACHSLLIDTSNMARKEA